MWQVPPAAIEPPLRLIELLLAEALRVPLQVLVAPGVLATFKPEGNGSLKLTAVATVGFGFWMSNITVVVPPTGMDGAPKLLKIEGNPITVSVAVLLVVPGPFCVELSGPVVLFFRPEVVPFTLTEM